MNYGIAGSVGIIAFNFIIGGLIGGFVAVFRLMQAVWYCLKCLAGLVRSVVSLKRGQQKWEMNRIY